MEGGHRAFDIFGPRYDLSSIVIGKIAFCSRQKWMMIIR